MTKRTRRNHASAFKAKVALAAIKGGKTITQLADQFGVHVSQITQWKEQLQAGAADVFDGGMPDVRSLRIPLRYLANLLTAGDEEPIAAGLERMLAMRAYMRSKTVDGVIDEAIAERVGLTGQQIEQMYHIMAIANYEDRFVIPTTHREVRAGSAKLHRGLSRISA